MRRRLRLTNTRSQQRNSARSIGLTITQYLMLIPIFYLIFGSAITGGTDTDMAYAGGLMATAVLVIGGCTPTMILGWTKRDPDPEDAPAGAQADLPRSAR